MPGLDGTGPRGMGPVTGGGRGLCSPYATRFAWQPYRARRRAPSGFPGYGTYGFRPFYPRMNREQELEFLKGQADMLRDELKELEKEIGELPGEQK
ncbi:MAG: hypothetical protein C4555_06595 [Dehalococcoidia bacterium]|nr:MAG: hypothetical protein C4555_06595 [Dehalococcoidia bacterium]